MGRLFYRSIPGLFLLLILHSCTKEISPPLNDTGPQIVITGSINNLPGADTIRISHTGKFYGPNSFTPVAGALVTISDNPGGTEILTETAPGIYITTFTQGIEGHTYTLSVKANNKVYSATSTLPYTVLLDTAYVTETIKWGETVKGIRVKLQDPANISNFYRFILTRNGKDFTAPFLLEDRLNNGTTITYDIAQASEDPIVTGDHIKVSLLGIDKNIYKYFLTIPSKWEPPAVPANPISNIDNGALGYFSAETISCKTLVVE